VARLRTERVCVPSGLPPTVIVGVCPPIPHSSRTLVAPAAPLRTKDRIAPNWSRKVEGSRRKFRLLQFSDCLRLHRLAQPIVGPRRSPTKPCLISSGGFACGRGLSQYRLPSGSNHGQDHGIRNARCFQLLEGGLVIHRRGHHFQPGQFGVTRITESRDSNAQAAVGAV
jgi:hypothetical protein